MDLQQIIKVLKTAAKTVHDIKSAAPSPALRPSAREPLETLLDQYCQKNRLQFSRESTRNGCNCHVLSDFFRLDITVIAGAATDVSIHQQRDQTRGLAENCPQMTKALRLRDMSEFDVHVSGLLKMYSASTDKSKRLQFFLSLSALESDFNVIRQQLMQLNIEPLELVRSAPFGLMVPRMEGLPFSLGFFVAPTDLFEKSGKLLKKEYHVIAGRRLGLWASVLVRAIKGLQTRLPSNSLYRNLSQLADGSFVCEFGALEAGSGYDLPGSFVLVLDRPVIVLESALNEIKQLTDIIVQPSPKTPGSMEYIKALRSASLPDLSKDACEEIYRVILPGQHHVYSLTSSPDMSVMTVSEISFTHTSQIPQLINILRRQAALNQLISSCMRDVAEDELCDPFSFHVAVTSAKSIVVSFSHPLNSAPAKMEIRLNEIGIASCDQLESSPRLCRDQQATIWLNKTFSIPVVLKTAIDRFVASFSTPSSSPRVIEPVRRPSVAVAPPAVPSPPPDITLLLATESPLPSPLVSRDVKQEQQTYAVSPSSSYPSATAPSVRRTSSKMELMLKEGRSSQNHAKEKAIVAVDKDIPMDMDVHRMKMRELYTDNPKKRLRKQEGEKDYAEHDEKEVRVKKVRAPPPALTPPGSVPTAVRSESLDSSLEIQPKSEPSLTSVRVRNADSPHGSPTPLKLKLSIAKLPSTSESGGPTVVKAIIPKEPSVKRKKDKVKVPDTITVDPKPVTPKIDPNRKQSKRDVFEFDAGPEPKKARIEPETIPASSEPPKKVKKEQPGEVEFLPSNKGTKKGADLSELGATLNNRKNIPVTPAPKTSPAKPPPTTTATSLTAALSRPPVVSTANTPKFPPTTPTHHATTAKPAPRETTSSSSSSLKPPPHAGQFGARTPPGKASAIPVVTVSPQAFNIPKPLDISSLGKIPKKSPVVPAASAPPRPVAPTVVPVAPVSVPKTPDLISALTGTFGAPPSGRVLLPTPSVSAETPVFNPFAPAFQVHGDRKEPERTAQSTTVKTATPAATTEKLPPTAKPPSLFRQVVGTVPEAPATLAEDDPTARKTSPDTAGTGDIVTSPTVKRPLRSISSVLDRLTSKSKIRPDTAEGSHDSSDVADHVAGGSDAVEAAGPADRSDTVISPEIPVFSGGGSAGGGAVQPQEAAESRTEPPPSLLRSSSQLLVPYSSDDDASLDESVLTIDTATEAETVKPAPPPQSPEITTVRAAGEASTALLTAQGWVLPAQTAHNPASTLVADSLHVKSSPDRTSPVIVDDPLFDEAFT